VSTGLNFVIHAPFLLTDSREGIKIEEAHNVDMEKKLLADLSVSSFFCLYEIGKKANKQIVGDTLFDVFPYQEYKLIVSRLK